MVRTGKRGLQRGPDRYHQDHGDRVCVQTHALQGSNPSSLSTDQRGAGYPRQQDATVDIGAFEWISSSADPQTAGAGCWPSVSPGATPMTAKTRGAAEFGLSHIALDILPGA